MRWKHKVHTLPYSYTATARSNKVSCTAVMFVPEYSTVCINVFTEFMAFLFSGQFARAVSSALMQLSKTTPMTLTSCVKQNYR